MTAPDLSVPLSNALAVMEQNLGTDSYIQNDDFYLLKSNTQSLTDDPTTMLHETTDIREPVQDIQFEVSSDSLPALEKDAYTLDSRRNSSCVTINSFGTDLATSETCPVNLDPSMPSSSPLPPSSSPPQFFSSSPLPSSQSSTIEYSSDILSDLKERQKLNSHEHSIAECFVNPENILHVETSFSCSPTLETSYPTVAKHFPGSPTCNELLNDDDGATQCNHRELEPESADVELREPNVEISLAPLMPSLNKDIETEDVEVVKADQRDVSTYEDLTPQSSLYENLSFRVDIEPTGSEEMIIREGKSVFNTRDSSIKPRLCTLVHAELPLFDLQIKSLSNKRKIEDENTNQTSLKKRYHTHVIDSVSSFPNPKRSTIAFQQLQHRKLISPFRSPALTRHSQSMDSKFSIPESSLAHVSTSAPAEQTMTTELTQPFSDELSSKLKLKHRTRRASAPFKSPLSSDAITKLTAVRMTPTIQALERKVQLLKRAIKIKDGGEEEILLELAKKWTEAGRDIAWEVWDLVKDNASKEDRCWSGSEKQYSRIPTFKDSWGWDDETNRQEKERNWGWDVEPGGAAMNVHENGIFQTGIDDDNDKTQDTLGTMLIQLGIAPDTLGWNEEDGEFQDV